MNNAKEFPRLSFGVIVLDGGPFTKYLLRQLYPHAFEIIVVEGGSKKAASYAPNGHALDKTLESLYEFKSEEDTENKLHIITKDGFWNEKDDQSRAYADIAKGDYLWQVDIDEFYNHDDIEKIRSILQDNPKIETVSFRQITFWGSIHYSVDSFRLRADNASQYHRLFRWKSGYKYLTHRPPTVIDRRGMNLREKCWLTAEDTESLGIYLYHYSLLFPKQVLNKASYYSNPGENPSVGYLKGAEKWAEDMYLQLKNPFRVHNSYFSISWLNRYNGQHPEQISKMWQDIAEKKLDIELRPVFDIENVLSNKLYLFSCHLLTIAADFMKMPPLSKFRKFISLLYIKFIGL